MNIFKTFEIFLREPLSILREKFIQIVNVQTGAPAEMSGINADLLDGRAQITVINNEKMYNLLSTAMYKKRKKAEAQLSPQEPKQIVIGQLLKRE